MIPDDLPKHKPEIAPLVPLDPEYAFPVNDPGLDALPRVDPDGPRCCPPGFCRKASALLDMVALAQAVLSDLQAALETEVVP
jgi:hypothetical protein